jgi:hypothetical protein
MPYIAMKKMINYISRIGLLGLLFVLPWACSEDARQGLRPLSVAFGSVNQVRVVMDEDLWESPLGDTLQYYYSAAYPILPQPEPIFDLYHLPPDKLINQQVQREFRTFMLIGDLSDTTSTTTQLILKDIGPERAAEAKTNPKLNSFVGRNKWSNGQLIIYVFAYSKEALIDVLKENYPAIANKIHDHDKPKVEATLFVSGENKKLMEEVKGRLGADIRLPKEYFLALKEGNMMWIRRETDAISSNLLMYKVPYTDQSQLTKAGIKAIRDSLGRRYISSTLPDTYMRTNDVDLPMFTSIKTVNSNYTLEARGIWDIVNDYMGGSFVSYLIYNPNKRELLFVDGFLHAPGKDKRNHMQHLEYLLSSIRY